VVKFSLRVREARVRFPVSPSIFSPSFFLFSLPSLFSSLSLGIAIKSVVWCSGNIPGFDSGAPSSILGTTFFFLLQQKKLDCTPLLTSPFNSMYITHIFFQPPHRLSFTPLLTSPFNSLHMQFSCTPLLTSLLFSSLLFFSKSSRNLLSSSLLFSSLLFQQSPHAALMYITTEAGTYIKEFVHSDLGRTNPSIASILDREVDILSLDVHEVCVEFPPKP
jgi:Pus10, C-terminal